MATVRIGREGWVVLVAKRRLAETWREAVAARASAASRPECVAAFDGAVQSGDDETAAAYWALAAHDLLWEVTAPGLDPVEVPAALLPAGSNAS